MQLVLRLDSDVTNGGTEYCSDSHRVMNPLTNRKRRGGQASMNGGMAMVYLCVRMSVGVGDGARGAEFGAGALMTFRDDP